MIYQTKNNEVLDYICWKNYFRSTLLDSLLAQEAEQYDPAQQIMEIFDFGKLNNRTDEQLGKIVNKVYAANPGLIQYGIFLPPGLNIFLPEIDEIATAGAIVQLWD